MLMTPELSRLLFTDDNRPIYKFRTLCLDINFKISAEKTKAIAFVGIKPIRTKIVIDDYPTEQVGTV